MAEQNHTRETEESVPASLPVGKRSGSYQIPEKDAENKTSVFCKSSKHSFLRNLSRPYFCFSMKDLSLKQNPQCIWYPTIQPRKIIPYNKSCNNEAF